MGLIEIRRRTERLGNLGNVHMADTATGAASAFSSIGEAARARGQAGREIGKAISGLGDAAGRIIDAIAASEQRRDNEMADRYVARYQTGMDAYNNGSLDETGQTRVKGAMEEDFSDSAQWIDGNIKYRDDFGEKLAKELDMSDNALEIARKRLVGYNLHMQNRWQNHAAQVDDRRFLAAANESLAAARKTYFDCATDGQTTPQSPDFAVAAADYSAAVEHALDAAHIPEEARPAERRKLALQFCQDAFARRINAAEARVEAGEDATGEQAQKTFEEMQKAIARDGWRAVFLQGTAAKSSKGETIIDPIAKDIAGADEEAFKAAAQKDLAAALNRAQSKVYARENAARREEAATAKKEEARLIMQDPETWEDGFTNLAEQWKDRNVEIAANFRQEHLRLKAAREKSAAQAAAAKSAAGKEAQKAANDALWQNVRREILEVFTSEEPMENRAQRERALVTGELELFRLGAITPEQHETFLGKLAGYRKEDTAAAMRSFLAATSFPFDADFDGRISPSERSSAMKEGGSVEIPALDGDERKTLKMEKFLALADQFANQLERLPRDASRKVAADELVKNFSAIWSRSEFEENLSRMARAIGQWQTDEAARPVENPFTKESSRGK